MFYIYIYIYIIFIFFIHLSVNRHLGCFHISVIVSNAAMNMRMQKALQDPDFNSSGYIPKRGLVDHIVVLLLIC